MIVVCENCQSRFKLDEDRIRTTRFKARCSRCHHVFSANKPLPPEAIISAADLPAAPPAVHSARVIAISNQKGGVAKTTTCLNLGISLTLLHKRVLLIDFDVQSNLTISLGYQNMGSFYDLLNAPAASPAERFLVETPHAGLWLLPSNKNMVLLNKKYFGAPHYEYILRDRLRPLQERFDYVLIDTPPSIEFFTLNALTASNLVIVPTQCDFLSTHGVDQIMKLIDLVARKTNPDVAARLLITMYDNRSTATQVIYTKLQNIYRNRTFKTLIDNDEKLREAQIMSLPVIRYDQDSRSGRQYMNLAREVLELTQPDGRRHDQ